MASKSSIWGRLNSSGCKMPQHMMSFILEITNGVCLLMDPMITQQKMRLQAAWSPSTGEAATCKGMRGCHQFAEVMAFGVALEHAQEHHWHWVYIYRDSWVITNMVQKWLKDWNCDNQQQWGKSRSAAAERKVIQQLFGETSTWIHGVNVHIWNSNAIWET